MKSEEIDSIIAQAVSESKRQSKWHRPKRSVSISKARNILNIIFMLGFLAAVVIYLGFPQSKVLFFSVGFGAIAVKLLEFYLRFFF